MRFWWPDWQPRERSLSSDSECSTDSHSSLASDASFYDAPAVAETGSGDETPPRPDDTQLVDGYEGGWSDRRLFPDGSPSAYPQAVGPTGLGQAAVGQGVGVSTIAPVSTPAGPGNGLCAAAAAKWTLHLRARARNPHRPVPAKFPRAQRPLSRARLPGLRSRFGVPSTTGKRPGDPPLVTVKVPSALYLV